MRHLNRHAIGILLSSVSLLAQASPPNGGQSAEPKSSKPPTCIRGWAGFIDSVLVSEMIP
jgi:hypothetical protein